MLLFTVLLSGYLNSPRIGIFGGFNSLEKKTDAHWIQFLKADNLHLIERFDWINIVDFDNEFNSQIWRAMATLSTPLPPSTRPNFTGWTPIRPARGWIAATASGTFFQYNPHFRNNPHCRNIPHLMPRLLRSVCFTFRMANSEDVSGLLSCRLVN